MTDTAWLVLGGYFLLMSIVDFVLMGIDKGLSKGEHRRIPEKRLFLFAALGGALGGVLGMSVFRHKTQHRSFLFLMPLFLVINVAAFVLIVYLINRLA